LDDPPKSTPKQNINQPKKSELKIADLKKKDSENGSVESNKQI
jgi:hypothetical protein